MAVPDFQNMLLPFVRTLLDGEVYHLSEISDRLGQELQVSEEDRKEMLPSGKQKRFNNRVGWAGKYLSEAGLVERVERGKYRISELGKKVILEEKPGYIDVKYLKQYEGVKEFLGDKSGNGGTKTLEEGQATPEEALSASYQRLRGELSQELLREINNHSPEIFEQLVVDLLVSMGYGGTRKDAGQAIGKTKDGGVDGIIKEDKLGLDVIYVQAKRWQSPVGRPLVQAFTGSIEGHKARKGVFITTSSFSQEAREYVKNIEKRIILIDGKTMVDLMMDYGVGVVEVDRYVVQKIDLDYFIEE